MLKNILCADIGGTNCRFAHFTLETKSEKNEKINLISQHICNTSELKNTDDFLEVAACTNINFEQADFICLGLAGPIESDGLGVKLTNAPLHLDFRKYDFAKSMEKFKLVNDFVLQAHACLIEDLEVFYVLENDSRIKNSNQNKKQIPEKTKGILGAGTGLGTAALIPNLQNTWTILQAEGGHVDMSIQTEQERDFAEFATKFLNKKKLSAEDILSGQGLTLLHAYVHGQNLPPHEVASIIFKSEKNSLQLSLYTRFLGRFCRHWALNTLCLGGLYLGGGVFRKNPSIFQHQNFIQEFYDISKPMQDIIKQIDLILIKQENAALWGGANLAKQYLFPYGSTD